MAFPFLKKFPYHLNLKIHGDEWRTFGPVVCAEDGDKGIPFRQSKDKIKSKMGFIQVQLRLFDNSANRDDLLMKIGRVGKKG